MREIDKVLNQDEKILWEGKPNFWPFYMSGVIGGMSFGALWMVFLIPFIVPALTSLKSGGTFFGLAFFAMPHFWIGIFLLFGTPIVRYLQYLNIYYAITDKRVILQKGIIGRDFEIADYDQITNAQVVVGFFDKIFGDNSGSIDIATAGTFITTKNGVSAKPYVMRNISNPYELFKYFKKLTYDIKTDIEYPNKLRPNENPGFNTNYTGSAAAVSNAEDSQSIDIAK
jgi:membrane protein YdbS with pleckstrin-like domain